jgi:hypothetical protein
MTTELRDEAHGPSAASVPVEPSGAISLRVLDPMQRMSEVLFGLIMVLTFTGSLEAATAGKADVRAMLVAALGCNLAWGIIDGGMYLMSCLHERGRKLMTLRAVRDATDDAVARRMIAEALPPKIAALLPADQLALLHGELRRLEEPSRYATPGRSDWLGAVGVCVLVFTATLPVVVPFMLIAEAKLALRASNAVAIVMLFLCGWVFGHCAGFPRMVTGLGMVVVGSALVAMAIALGG